MAKTRIPASDKRNVSREDYNFQDIFASFSVLLEESSYEKLKCPL